MASAIEANDNDDGVIAKNIPDELKKLDQWVCWRLRDRGKGKKNQKVPKIPGTTKNASVLKPDSWRTFRQAIFGWELGDADGIGIVLTKNSGIVGIDLDDCRDPESGKITQWPQKIVDDLDSYTEISPSGTGLRIFLRGSIPKDIKADSIELYSDRRLMTVTGRRLSTSPRDVRSNDRGLKRLFDKVVGEREDRNVKDTEPDDEEDRGSRDSETERVLRNIQSGPIFLLSYREFRAAGTSVRGSQRTSTIVRTGPYRFSRNPIYLAFVLFVLGLSVWLSNLWLLVTLVPAVGIIAMVVIPREERFLERNFNDQYSSYKAQVRRWL